MRRLISAVVALMAGPVFVSSANANSWWSHGCLQGMQQKYGTRFDQQQMQSYCQCRDGGKKSSDECRNHLGLEQQNNSSKKFSNEEEFTIGVMTATICGKRLGSINEQRSNEILLSALSKQSFSLGLATKETLWVEAYQTIGQGLEWCKANQ